MIPELLMIGVVVGLAATLIRRRQLIERLNEIRWLRQQASRDMVEISVIDSDGLYQYLSIRFFDSGLSQRLFRVPSNTFKEPQFGLIDERHTSVSVIMPNVSMTGHLQMGAEEEDKHIEIERL